ncbi:MAG: alpha/beta hydrolase family protein [Beijerinckiaceae bacterium]
MTATPTETRAALAALLGGFAPTSFRIAERHACPVDLPGVAADEIILRHGNEKVRALLTRPAGAVQGCPAILYIHAHGNTYAIGADELITGRPALLAPPYAQALADNGFAALCIDLPCFGVRCEPQESVLAKQHLWNGTTLFGAMLNDLAGALTILHGLPEVDAARTGVMGLSMGATLSFWLAALDERIAATAHLCCFADLATLVRSDAHDLHGIYMMVPGLTQKISTGMIAGLSAPRPQLACMGAADPLTPPDALARGIADLRAAYEWAGASDTLEILVDPGTGHKETPRMRAAVLAFFRRTLQAK